jgi:hypothetical protein
MQNTVVNVLLVIHLLGIAFLLAGFFSDLKSIRTGSKVTAGVLHGSYLMLITGLAMSALVAEPAKLNGLVVALKAIALTVIFFVAYTYRKKDKTPVWVMPSIFGLVLFNIVLAIFGPVYGA